MKLFEIRKTTSEKSLPKWANETISDDIFSVSKIGMHLVKVVTSLPKHYKGWGGSWAISPQAVITVFIEKSFADACKKKKAPWALDHLIKHELTEAKIAIRLARDKYPDKNPYVMAEEDENLGGSAHYLAIKELDHMSQSTYDTNLDLESHYLEWKY